MSFWNPGLVGDMMRIQTNETLGKTVVILLVFSTENCEHLGGRFFVVSYCIPKFKIPLIA